MKRLLNSPSIYLIFVIPIIIGLSFIWVNLDIRPLHHDESLNAIYGLYYYLDPKYQFYKYDPMLHGPLLYHLLPWIYHLIDESYFSIRLIPAFIFSLIPLLITYLLKDRFGWKVLIGIALLITGPSYIYWAKFLRHDQLVILMIVLMGMAFHPKFLKIKAYCFIIPLILHFCIKENAYVHLAILAGFIIFEWLVKKKDLFILSSLKTDRWHLLVATALGLILYCYFYSAGFVYPEGILDGLYRKSLSYWSNQHSIERISGPFLTQFFTLFWYELPVLLLFIFTSIKLHFSEKSFLKWLPFILVFVSVVFHILYGKEIPKDSIWNSVVKLKLGIDFYGFFFLLFLSVSGTYILITQDKRITAFFYYLTTASFFTYSYLGEKVPWLSLYILLPMIIFLIFFWKNATQISVIAIATIAILFNLTQAYRLNFINMGSSTEFISQVHTSKDYEVLAKKLRSGLDKAKFNVLAYKENTWPLTWYLYGRDGYRYHLGKNSFEDFDIILDKYPSQLNLKGYKRTFLPLRHWWVPDWSKMNWLNFIGYSFHHRPWNPSGDQKISIYVKSDLLDF